MKNFCTLLIAILTISSLHSQQKKNSFFVEVGYGFERLDNRIEYLKEFSYHIYEVVSTFSETPNDILFLDIGIRRQFKKRLNFDISLGASRIHHDRIIPISNKFFDVTRFNLIWNSKYLVYSFSESIGVDYLLMDRKYQIRAGINLKSNHSFHKKTVNRLGTSRSLTRIEYSGIELFPTLKTKYGSFEFTVICRVFNLHFRDDALLNNGKISEVFNPLKTAFQMAYFF